MLFGVSGIIVLCCAVSNHVSSLICVGELTSQSGVERVLKTGQCRFMKILAQYEKKVRLNPTIFLTFQTLMAQYSIFRRTGICLVSRWVQGGAAPSVTSSRRILLAVSEGKNPGSLKATTDRSNLYWQPLKKRPARWSGGNRNPDLLASEIDMCVGG